MKTLTVRLPDSLAADIEEESRRRKVSKSDVIRDRLSLPSRSGRRRVPRDPIVNLVGTVDGLPSDLSAQKKEHLAAAGYGRKPTR